MSPLFYYNLVGANKIASHPHYSSLCSVAIPCTPPLLLLPFGVAMTVALLFFPLASVVFVLLAYVVYCLRTRFLGCDRRPSRISKMLL